jgi:hypothetical protein
VREFYRIVRSERPGPEDFQSIGDDGADCSRSRYPRECAGGVSVWDNVEAAIKKARSLEFRRGSFLATLHVPEDDTVEFAKTMGAHHFTIYYGSPESILALMRKPAVRIPGAPEDR